MKQYAVIDTKTSAQVAGPFEELQVAHRVVKALGSDFAIVTWVGHFGLPAVACVFREVKGMPDQLETVCLYTAEARRIANHKNLHERGTFTVRTVLLNTAFQG